MPIFTAKCARRSCVNFTRMHLPPTQGREPNRLVRQTLRTEREGTDTTYVAKTKPVSIIVRRGASRRFDSLKRNTADLPVVISWDRRTGDRRESPQAAPVERRSGDRRKTPPFTWEAADFVVVGEAEEPDATAAPPVTKLDSTATNTAGDRTQKRRPKNVDSNGNTSADAKLRKRSE